MFTREASSLDLFTDSVRLMGDATLCAVMEFDRGLDPCRLQGAFHACVLAHPVLHSRLVRGKGPAFWQMVDLPLPPPLQVEECSGDYHHRVIGPVDPYGPLQIRIRLLQGPSGDIITLNLAHAAADAFGLQFFMSQLLEEYHAPGSVSPAEGGIPERDTLWTRELHSEHPHTGSGMRIINPLWPDPFGTSRGRSSFHRYCVQAQEIDAFRAYARNFGGNINDVVMSAYILAMSDLTHHNGPANIFFPVNLRQHLDDGSRVMSNQATNVCFPIERRTGEEMGEILPRVIDEIKILKGRGIGISEQVEMDEASDPAGVKIHTMVEEMAALQNKGFADIFISNPGTLTLPDSEGLSDAYVCYPGGYMPTTCFITSTFRGRMTITMGYQDSERTRSGTRKAVQIFMRYLHQCIE